MNTYLFDFDGTLVDSMPTYTSTLIGILDEYHIPYGDDLVKIITPLGLHDSAVYFMQLGVPLSKEEILMRMRERMFDAYAHRIPAKSNVISVLHALKARGCSLNVLTASPHLTLDPCLKRLGIYDLFDNVWSCEDFGLNKANPEIYHQAARRMGVPVGSILFLDDNLNADRTAKAAGMKVCGVYDPSSHEYTEEIKACTDCYIYDFEELLHISV